MNSALDTQNSSPEVPLPRRRILIVDDHPLMRRGLTALIEKEPDLIVCAAAGTHQSGLEAIATARPDLVITDLSMNNAVGAGLDLIKSIRAEYESLPLLALTNHDSPYYSSRALLAGANGYISKEEPGETLLAAIRCLLDGKDHLSAELSAGLNRR